MIYTHTQITLKLGFKWMLFLLLLNVLLAVFFWLIQPEFPFTTHFFYGFISGYAILIFAAFPQIFLKKAPPFFRLLMVSASAVIGNISGLLFISTLIVKMPYNIMMFFFILNLMLTTIITGFLYYWEGIADTNSKLQEERIKRLDMENKIVQTRLRLVQAPIEPGFLFTALKQVLKLLDIDIAGAKTLQLVLIQYLRMSLNKLKKETHALEKEIQIIRAYLDILKKFPEKTIAYQINITDNIHEIQIQPMLLHVVMEMIVDGLEILGVNKYNLQLNGRKSEDMPTIEFRVSGINNLDTNNILHLFEDIGEKLQQTFGDRANLGLNTDMPANFTITLTFRPGPARH